LLETNCATETGVEEEGVGLKDEGRKNEDGVEEDILTPKIEVSLGDKKVEDR